MLDVLPLPEVEADQSNQGHRPHQVTSSQPSISSPASTSPSTGQATINIASKLDALGEFIKLNTNFFVDKNSWVQLFHLCKGRSNLNRRIWSLRHRAAPFLHRFAKNGIPVLLQSKPWSSKKKDDAFHRGNHPTIHLPRPSLNSFVKRWERYVRKEWSLSFRTSCSRTWSNCEESLPSVESPSVNAVPEWSTTTPTSWSTLTAFTVHLQKPCNGDALSTVSSGMSSLLINAMGQFFSPKLTCPMASERG